MMSLLNKGKTEKVWRRACVVLLGLVCLAALALVLCRVYVCCGLVVEGFEGVEGVGRRGGCEGRL